jgi:hypothetical protein
MKYFDQDNPPEIPLDLFCCPICGAQVVFVEINEYETETGKVTDTGFHVSCTTEPKFDDPDYDDWLNSHFSMPYVDWLPLEVKIYKWLSAGFRLRLPTLREPDLWESTPLSALSHLRVDPHLEANPIPPTSGLR